MIFFMWCFCSVDGVTGSGCGSSAHSGQNGGDHSGVSVSWAGDWAGRGRGGRRGAGSERESEEHLVLPGGRGQHSAEQRAAAEDPDRAGQELCRRHGRVQRSGRQEGGQDVYSHTHTLEKSVRRFFFFRFLTVFVVQFGFSPSFQSQISFQQQDSSEAKRSSDLTEIIINVRLHTHTHTPAMPSLSCKNVGMEHTTALKFFLNTNSHKTHLLIEQSK